MAERFWRLVDRVWLAAASVKVTLVILLALTLLSVPGTLILQHNISNVDPGIQYDYNFWKWGNRLQLFTSYHSFWFVGLMVLLSLNLIACSIERWPQMYKLASAKAIRWSKARFDAHNPKLQHEWDSQLPAQDYKKRVLQYLEKKWQKPLLLEDEQGSVQIFWQQGRWSRVANYLVHTSLLVIFAGAIYSSLYGFEGAANIPSGAAVDTFLIFNEGKSSGLRRAPGGLSNERMLGFRLEAESFKVSFYEDFPGRPSDFVSRLNVLRGGQRLASGTIRVNDPMNFENFYFYQASYGRLGDFDLRFRAVNRRDLGSQIYVRTRLGEPQDLTRYQTGFVALRAMMDVQGLGPGVQLQEIDELGALSGESFWVLRDHPQLDFSRDAPYALILDHIEERFFTGLQIGHDPGAPIYWLGCLGMLIGTFYALLVTHRKYYLHIEKGKVRLAGTIHRLPFSFENQLQRLSKDLKSLEVKS